MQQSALSFVYRGVKDVMKKRLKSHYKKQKLMQSTADGGLTDTYYDYICVVDFEATCEKVNPPDFHHEIIEFPMVLINTRTLDIVSRVWVHKVFNLQQFVCEHVSPAGGLVSGIRETRTEPSAFRLLCESDRDNTGWWIILFRQLSLISHDVMDQMCHQRMVDEADPFPAVLERVVAWLQERELGTKYKYAILTDGYV